MPYPAAGEDYSGPEEEREAADDFQLQRGLGHVFAAVEVAVDAVMEPGHVGAGEDEQDHFPLECGVEDVGCGAGDEHAEAGDGGEDEGPPCPGDQFPRQVADRIAHCGQAQQAQVDEQDGADHHGNGDDVDRFDEGEQPGAADFPAQWPVLDIDPEWGAQEIGKHSVCPHAGK